MRKFSAFFLLLLMISCEYFGLHKSNKEELVQNEMKNINWNDVDKYPLFEYCDETASKKKQKECFQSILTNNILNSISENNIEVSKSINDTIHVQLLVSNKGVVTILNIEKSELIAQEIPQLNRYIATSIQRLPKIYPALKRDIPVSAKFSLPIILKAN